MRANDLQNALTALGDPMREVNAAIEEMRREHDPLAVHIFVPRRKYRNVNDTKSGKTKRYRCAPQLAVCLRAGISRNPRRMGTADGRGREAVNICQAIGLWSY